MNKSKSNSAAVLMLLFSVSAIAGDKLKNRDALCNINAHNKCEVRFNMKKSGAAYFRVQQFDSNIAEWETLDAAHRAWRSGDTVESGHFYRVLACDDEQGTVGCKKSRLFWAPTVVPESAIPSRVQMFDLDGASEWARVDSEASRDSKLRQLNVYQMAASFGMVGGNIRGKMTRPLDHDHDEDENVEGVAHLENMIHHDVYQQYSAMKEVAKAARQK